MTKNTPCAIKTKAKMAEAVKSLMNTKSFDKITVSDITTECGIHRQTFYYHFQDRYELVDWIIYNELLVPFMEGLTFANMYSRFNALLETIESEKSFYQRAMRLSSGEVSKYLNVAARELFVNVISALDEETKLVPDDTGEYMIFVEFVGFGLTGIVMSWVQRGMKETSQELTEKLIKLVEKCKEFVSDK